MKRLFQFAAMAMGLYLMLLPAAAMALCRAATCSQTTHTCCRHAHADMGNRVAMGTRGGVCSRPCCTGSEPAAIVPQPAAFPPAAALYTRTASPRERQRLHAILPAPAPRFAVRATARYVLYRDLRI